MVESGVVVQEQAEDWGINSHPVEIVSQDHIHLFASLTMGLSSRPLQDPRLRNIILPSGNAEFSRRKKQGRKAPQNSSLLGTTV